MIGTPCCRLARDKDAARKEFNQIFDSPDQRVATTSLQTIFGIFAKRMEFMQAAFKNLNTLEMISTNTSLEPPPVPSRNNQIFLEQAKMGTDYANSGKWLFGRPDFLDWVSSTAIQHCFWLCGSVWFSIVSGVIGYHLQISHGEEGAAEPTKKNVKVNHGVHQFKIGSAMDRRLSGALQV